MSRAVCLFCWTDSSAFRADVLRISRARRWFRHPKGPRIVRMLKAHLCSTSRVLKLTHTPTRTRHTHTQTPDSLTLRPTQHHTHSQ
eukprot:2104382-Pyramimonas_sp.AAC.1